MKEAGELVRRIKYQLEPENRSGIGLHLDTAAMHGAKDDPEKLASAVRDYDVRGVDVSAPGLARLSLAHYAAALRDANYQGWMSLEMGGPLAPDVIRQEIDYIREQCGLHGN